MPICSVDFPACFFGALLLLTLPLNWLGAAIFAAAFHELCHILAIRLLGGLVFSIGIHLGGAVIEAGSLSHSRELLCALAGPLGSAALVLLCPWFPRTAFCAFGHAVFNLLPLYPLDGGRALRCLVSGLSENNAVRICRGVEIITIGFLFFLAIVGTFFLHLGILPVLLTSSLLIKALTRKIPCKPPQLGVQ